MAPLLHMTFYMETLEDLFCIAPSPASQLINPHHSFIPPMLTEPLVSATHCTRAWDPVIMEHSIHRRSTFLSSVLSRQVCCTLPPFTCSVHSCVFMMPFFLGVSPPRKLATTPFQLSLEISPSSQSGKCSFLSESELSGLFCVFSHCAGYHSNKYFLNAYVLINV